MLCWYLIHRYYFNDHGVLAMEPIDGVYCSSIGVAFDIARERNFLTDKDKLRVARAANPREVKLAKSLDRSHKMIDLMPLDEFVEWMKMPALAS